jgi:hypothetical protein
MESNKFSKKKSDSLGVEYYLEKSQAIRSSAADQFDEPVQEINASEETFDEEFVMFGRLLRFISSIPGGVKQDDLPKIAKEFDQVEGVINRMQGYDLITLNEGRYNLSEKGKAILNAVNEEK